MEAKPFSEDYGHTYGRDNWRYNKVIEDAFIEAANKVAKARDAILAGQKDIVIPGDKHNKPVASWWEIYKPGNWLYDAPVLSATTIEAGVGTAAVGGGIGYSLVGYLGVLPGVRLGGIVFAAYLSWKELDYYAGGSGEGHFLPEGIHWIPTWDDIERWFSKEGGKVKVSLHIDRTPSNLAALLLFYDMKFKIHWNDILNERDRWLQLNNYTVADLNDNHAILMKYYTDELERWKEGIAIARATSLQRPKDRNYVKANVFHIAFGVPFQTAWRTWVTTQHPNISRDLDAGAWDKLPEDAALVLAYSRLGQGNWNRFLDWCFNYYVLQRHTGGSTGGRTDDSPPRKPQPKRIPLLPNPAQTDELHRLFPPPDSTQGKPTVSRERLGEMVQWGHDADYRTWFGVNRKEAFRAWRESHPHYGNQTFQEWVKTHPDYEFFIYAKDWETFGQWLRETYGFNYP